MSWPIIGVLKILSTLALILHTKSSLILDKVRLHHVRQRRDSKDKVSLVNHLPNLMRTKASGDS
jgi:hypothetical protein